MSLESFVDRNPPMPQTTNRFFDDLSRLMTDAAGLADGARREAETALRGQLERLLASMDVVTREEFEAAREMAALARAETEKLRERVAALEAKLANPGESPGSPPQA
jgi:BMFP domain-containing protein YqiC